MGLNPSPAPVPPTEVLARFFNAYFAPNELLSMIVIGVRAQSVVLRKSSRRLGSDIALDICSMKVCYVVAKCAVNPTRKHEWLLTHEVILHVAL